MGYGATVIEGRKVSSGVICKIYVHAHRFCTQEMPFVIAGRRIRTYLKMDGHEFNRVEGGLPLGSHEPMCPPWGLDPPDVGSVCRTQNVRSDGSRPDS